MDVLVSDGRGLHWNESGAIEVVVGSKVTKWVEEVELFIEGEILDVHEMG